MSLLINNKPSHWCAVGQLSTRQWESVLSVLSTASFHRRQDWGLSTLRIVQNDSVDQEGAGIQAEICGLQNFHAQPVMEPSFLVAHKCMHTYPVLSSALPYSLSSHGSS